MGKTKCSGCIYYRYLSAGSGDRACHYCIDTGKPRGIPPEQCYRHAGTPYKEKRREREDDTDCIAK